ncbi:hypothetical protein KGQ20_16435 [Catenulispora sp. NF23]|uniref:DNA-binding protein n=1 Tax=Catenulispora pinistramenti TaxID=2705254 RepID=A0ABS5L107_9ACTN|nr:hypothetical protein [Catenulispora pinistramenti]MBS2534359.1 hypothetical protein [Catenulispora pinistramenti]MBS2551835.1 hypothetical protein [Catenulispora pinistramenti]
MSTQISTGVGTSTGPGTSTTATSTAATAEALLDAGAVIPWTGKEGDQPGEREDVLQARAYRHPALTDRTVVRLVPRSLGEAEDLTMEFLGFDRPASGTDNADVAVAVAEVGVVLRKSLGFPAWALVHDPANGHHALALVKEIESLGRLARNKPGSAKDGFDALGKRLAAAVPHFLPSYYEQVGRMFLAAENKTYAATMFTKARDAERAHGLAVDEDVLAESFLEFALNGALPAKAVSEYARALSARTAAPEAFRRFRLLVTERTSGGLPPYSGLAADMKRLAKAAGLDVAAEELSLLRDLLDQPALAQAAKPFWVSYAAALARLAQTDPAVRGKLLAMNPAFPGAPNAEADTFWLRLLADCGAIDSLIAPSESGSNDSVPVESAAAEAAPTESAPAEAQPADGAAGWLGRFVKNRSRGWRWYRASTRLPELLDLVTRMAPRLRAEGRPLAIVDRRRIDVDLIDLCLELGLPVTGTDASANTTANTSTGTGTNNQPAWHFDIGDWLDAADTPDQRDLSAFAADPVFGPALDRSMDRFATGSSPAGGSGNGPIAGRFAELQAVPGLLIGVRRWLDRRATEVGEDGLSPLHDALRQIRRALSAKTAAVNPEALQKVAAFDVAPLLAEALRFGILDEYSWPALDAACAKLTGDGSELPSAGGEAFEIFTQWPYLVVKKGVEIAVVDGTGTVLEHTASIPTGTRLWNSTIRFADGQLLLMWYSYGSSSGAYWSGSPLRKLDRATFGGYVYDQFSSMEVPGHGRSAGDRPLRAGDTELHESADVFSDGTTYWRRGQAARDDWQEFDPATGTVGRTSMPSFFEDALPSGRSLQRNLCWIRPTAPGTQTSPMGTANGVLGWRAHQGSDGTIVGEAVDGRSVRLTPAGRGQLPVALVSFPGGDAPRALTTPGNQNQAQLTYLTLTDTSRTTAVGGARRIADLQVGLRAPKFAKGTWCVPPLGFWDYLVPRDEAGSRFLRALDAERARALMDAAKQALHDATTEGATTKEATPEEATPEESTTEKATTRIAAVAEAVKAALPGITHPNLVLGIAGYVLEAVEREADIARISETLDGTAQDETEADPVDPRLTRPQWNDTLQDVTTGLVIIGSSSYGQAPPPPGVALSWLVSAFHGRDISKQWRDGEKVRQAVELLAALPGLAYRAASPMSAEPVRRTLTELVQAVAASGLLEHGSALRGLRVVRLDGDFEKKKATTGKVLRTADGCIVFCDTGSEWDGLKHTSFWRGVQLTGADTFEAVADGWAVSGQTPIPQWPQGLLEQVAGLLATGPIAWDPAAVGQLAAATGMTSAEASLALAGLPGVISYGAGKLDTETRNRLGLKPAQAKAALNRFDRFPVATSAELLGALAGPGVAGLWERGPDIEAAAVWWTAKFGKRVAVSEELLTEAHAALKPRYTWQARLPVADILQGVAGIESWELLQTPGVAGTPGMPSGLDALAISDIVRALLWLAYRLPYGDPLRGALPGATELLRTRFRDPATRLTGGYFQGAAKIEAALGVKAVPDPEAKDGLKIGPFRATKSREGWLSTLVVPGELSGPDDPAVELVLTAGSGADAVPVIRTLLSEALDALMVVPEAAEPYPAQDPTRSVPDLVTGAAARLKLSQDAAALYLMVLALPDPTDRDTAAWTGWKPARLKAARAELGASPLVVTGSRPRAGRTLFLPGGWLALKTPVLPVEAWKSRWLGIDAQGLPALNTTMPRLPVPDLYAAAWQRVLDGDPPRLEELTTGRRR